MNAHSRPQHLYLLKSTKTDYTSPLHRVGARSLLATQFSIVLVVGRTRYAYLVTQSVEEAIQSVVAHWAEFPGFEGKVQ
jgi:hypothetical protein